jgi:hypothetical protein
VALMVQTLTQPEPKGRKDGSLESRLRNKPMTRRPGRPGLLLAIPPWWPRLPNAPREENAPQSTGPWGRLARNEHLTAARTPTYPRHQGCYYRINSHSSSSSGLLLPNKLPLILAIRAATTE